MASQTTTGHFFRACIPALLAAAALAAPMRAQENRAGNSVAKTVAMDELTRLIGGPTLVSLHFKSATRKAVFDELARQAGIGIDARYADTVDGKPRVPVSVDMERQPFWLALRALCTRFDLDIGTGSGPKPLFVVPRGLGISAGCPISGHGLVLFMAGSPQSPRELSLFLLVDPKMRLLDRVPALHLDAAMDEKGRTVFAPGNPTEAVGGGFGFVSNVLYFSDGGPSDSRRLAEARGTARLFVGFNIKWWTVPDILRARHAARTVPRPAGVSRYVVRKIAATSRGYDVHLSVSQREFDLQDVLPLYSQIEKRVHLFDARGREYVSGDARVENGIGDPVRFTVPFTRAPPGAGNSPGRPQTLVIEIPDVRAVEAPFGFNDLPLP